MGAHWAVQARPLGRGLCPRGQRTPRGVAPPVGRRGAGALCWSSSTTWHLKVGEVRCVLVLGCR